MVMVMMSLYQYKYIKYKWKNETCWNYSKNGEEGIRKITEGVDSTTIYCKTFVNVTVYSQDDNNMAIKEYKKQVMRINFKRKTKWKKLCKNKRNIPKIEEI
jgi:hypothetical protein